MIKSLQPLTDSQWETIMYAETNKASCNRLLDIVLEQINDNGFYACFLKAVKEVSQEPETVERLESCGKYRMNAFNMNYILNIQLFVINMPNENVLPIFSSLVGHSEMNNFNPT